MEINVKILTIMIRVTMVIRNFEESVEYCFWHRITFYFLLTTFEATLTNSCPLHRLYYIQAYFYYQTIFLNQLVFGFSSVRNRVDLELCSCFESKAPTRKSWRNLPQQAALSVSGVSRFTRAVYTNYLRLESLNYSCGRGRAKQAHGFCCFDLRGRLG